MIPTVLHVLVASVNMSINDEQNLIKGLVVISKHSTVYMHFSLQIIPIVELNFPL